MINFYIKKLIWLIIERVQFLNYNILTSNGYEHYVVIEKMN